VNKKPLVAGLLLLAFATACGDSNMQPQTKLKISVQTGDLKEHQFVVVCKPARGNTPNPDATCAKLDDHPEMSAPPEMTGTCLGSVGIPPEVTVRGSVNGEAISFSVRECDQPAVRAETARLWLETLGLA
jgi:hypothetical protein